MQITMLVVKRVDPATQTILVGTAGGVIMAGDGPVTFLCGRCGRPLLVNVTVAQAQRLVFQCGDCQAFNMSEV